MYNQIVASLSNFKRSGYARVSLSEIAFVTKLPKDSIIAELRKHGIKLQDAYGELYVQLETHSLTIQAHCLPKPKRTFEV